MKVHVGDIVTIYGFRHVFRVDEIDGMGFAHVVVAKTGVPYASFEQRQITSIIRGGERLCLPQTKTHDLDAPTP